MQKKFQKNIINTKLSKKLKEDKNFFFTKTFEFQRDKKKALSIFDGEFKKRKIFCFVLKDGPQIAKNALKLRYLRKKTSFSNWLVFLILYLKIFKLV